MSGWFKKKTSERQALQRDWTKTMPYAGLALLATLTTTGVATYKAFNPDRGQTQRQAVPPVPSPIPEQNLRNPLTASNVERQQRVCREWNSEKAEKRYNFVCRGKDAFEIYVVGIPGSPKIGSGTILEDSSVETEVAVSLKRQNVEPRSSRWKLRLSPDGERLEGTHSGDDPREFFPLTLQLAH